jgi:hypothetical protein
MAGAVIIRQNAAAATAAFARNLFIPFLLRCAVRAVVAP